MRFFSRLIGWLGGAGAAALIALLLVQGAPRDIAEPPSDREPQTASSAPEAASAGQAGPLEPAGSLDAFAARRLAVDPLATALQEAYPAAFSALMSELFEAQQVGEDDRALARRQSLVVKSLLSSKLQFVPYASAEALNGYFQYNLSVLDAVRGRFGPEACAEVVSRGGGALSTRLRLASEEDRSALVALLGRQTGLVLGVASEGERLGQRPLPTPQGSDWRQLYQQMEERGASRAEIAQFRQGTLQDLDQICDVTRHYYAALVGLSADAASRLHPMMASRLVGGGAIGG